MSLFVVLSASPAFAVVTRFTVVNQTNRQIQCAFAQIAVANPQAPRVTVYHWFVAQNGQSATFNGRTDGFYCESMDGQNVRWAGNAGFLCVSRNQYVNPFYIANDVNQCNQHGGEMVGFNNVSGNGNASVTLSP